MPVTERPSAFSGNKRPHNQLGLVPAKKMREQTRGDGMQLIQKEEKKDTIGGRSVPCEITDK